MDTYRRSLRSSDTTEDFVLSGFSATRKTRKKKKKINAGEGSAVCSC